MKNTLSGLFLALMLVAPSFSYAQVAGSAPASSDQMYALRAELIQILTDELNALIIQIRNNQESTSTQAQGSTIVSGSTTAPFSVYQIAYESDPNVGSYLGYNGSQTLSSVKITERKNEIFHSADTIYLPLEGYTEKPSYACGQTTCGGFGYRISLPHGIDVPGSYLVQLTSTSGATATWSVNMGYSGIQGGEVTQHVSFY
jgi:hypothetical protein